MGSVSEFPKQLARRLSLGTKLTLATLGVLSLVSALYYFQLTQREKEHLVSAKAKAAGMVADLLSASLSAPLDFGDPEGVDVELRNLKNNPEIVFAAVWSEDAEEPVASFGASSSGHSSKSDQAPLRITSDQLEVSRTVTGRAAKRVGSAMLVFSLDRENAAFVASRRRIFWLSALMAAGTAVVLITLARRQIVSPLGRIVDGLSRMERGEKNLVVEVASQDEIGRVARAFNAMAASIVDREHRLDAARRNLRDLFDGMRQAIFAFGPSGTVEGEVSRQAVLLFGENIEGKSVRDVLYAGAPAHDVDVRAFDEWWNATFTAGMGAFGELSAFAPLEASIEVVGRGRVPVELEFRPLTLGTQGESDVIEKIMVLATDVSETRMLEHAVRTQEEEHARQMAVMRKLIAGGAQVFVDFVDGAHHRLSRCTEIVHASPTKLASPDIDELFRHVHTLKGEAKGFDLRDFETVGRELEEQLDELRSAARGDGVLTSADVHEELLARLRRAADAVHRGREVFVAASPTGEAILDQVSVQRTDLSELMRLLGKREDALGQVAARLAARPFGESTANLMDMVPTWAEKEGKRARLEVEGRGVKVPPRLSAVLSGVLTHLVRNALAHGIETVAAREAAGKPAVGLVRIVAVPQRDHGPIIEVSDDGAGLDEGRIAASSAAVAGDASDVPASEAIFFPGVTTMTRADDMAGRGVGLDAVRAELARAGYVVTATSQLGLSTRFVLCPVTEAQRGEGARNDAGERSRSS